jgi:hypothetical protein
MWFVQTPVLLKVSPKLLRPLVRHSVEIWLGTLLTSSKPNRNSPMQHSLAVLKVNATFHTGRCCDLLEPSRDSEQRDFPCCGGIGSCVLTQAAKESQDWRTVIVCGHFFERITRWASPGTYISAELLIQLVRNELLVSSICCEKPFCAPICVGPYRPDVRKTALT